MKNIRVYIFIATLFFCFNAFAQQPATKTERKLIKQLQGNWIIEKDLSDSTIILTNFNWTTENIDNHFNYLNFYVLHNKVKAIIIRTNSLWGCGTAQTEGQEYKYNPTTSIWGLKDGLLHIELKYTYRQKEFELNNYYTVLRQPHKLILNKQSEIVTPTNTK